MNSQNKELSFRISSGLKNLIGRDLISDRYIAVFELVKNSYDAGASKATISFEQSDDGTERIIISDNGCGMTYADIINKWLFVAYSEKKPQHRQQSSFRDKIKREVAGAKGVGRFSCDRLGALLTLVTKTEQDKYANRVEVNWNTFELDDTKEFVNIPVHYSTTEALPSGFKSGTTLIIEQLREEWDRDALLRLKRSLMKLISPDANEGELPFDIELIVESERENDDKTLKKTGINPDRDIVNGIIHNDILFYSSEEQNMLSAIRKQMPPIDGVYLTKRDYTIFTEKAERIIQKIVKRSEDVVNLRGFVLDNTSAFEVRIREILNICWQKFKPEHKDVLSKAIEKQLENKSARVDNQIKAAKGAECTFTYANNNPYTLSVADRLDILQVVLPILNETYQMPNATVPHDFKQYYLDKVNVYRNKLGHITLGEKIIRVNGQDVEINQDLHRLLRRNISEVDSTIQKLEMYLTNHI